MTVVGINDFSLKDFIKPTPERMRRILSAVINFAKFREEQLSEFEKYTSETVRNPSLACFATLQKINVFCLYCFPQEQLTEKKHILEQENHGLAEKLHTARLQRAEEEPTIQKLDAEILSLTTEVNQLNKEQNAMQKDFSSIKTTATELTNKLVTAPSFYPSFPLNFFCGFHCSFSSFLSTVIQTSQTDSLAELRQTGAKLSSQIVESPEKLKQTLLDLETNMTAESDAVQVLEKNSRDLQLKIDSFSQVEVDVDKSMSLMEEAEVEMRKLQDSQHKVSSTHDSLSQKTIEHKELCLKEQVCFCCTFFDKVFSLADFHCLSRT